MTMSKNVQLSKDEFTLMRDLIFKLSGISIQADRGYLIESRLAGLVREMGCSSFEALHNKAASDSQLQQRIVDCITINETYWFRDRHPFALLREKLLPAYAKECREGKRENVRIWSAACSTGQEPYSIAMLVLEVLRQHPTLTNKRWEVLATDISLANLRQAEGGRYERIAIKRGLPQEYLDRHFKEDGRCWVLSDEVKSVVAFKQLNLMEKSYPFGRFDLIFCRNVAIYFSAEVKGALLNRLGASLRPEGILILGSCESIMGYSDRFEVARDDGATFYRLCR